MKSIRGLCFFSLIVCLAILSTAWFVEIKLRLEVCPLCMLQRFSLMAIGAILLIMTLHNPKKIGARCYVLIGWLFSAIGIGLAWRQLWLQSLPPEEHTTCLPGLGYIFQTMPFGEAIKTILHGTASCGTVKWDFIGMSLAFWSLLFFCFIALIFIVIWFQAPRK